MLGITEHCSPPAALHQQRDYGLVEIARKLALAHLSRRSIIATLRRLADSDGLPLPLNPRFHAGAAQRHSRRIGARSRWDAADFDDWLAHYRAGNGASANTARPAVNAKPTSLHTELARRAAKIAGRS